MRTHDLPRQIMAGFLPPEAGLEETVRWAVAYACAAPSELNTQPWRFVLRHSPSALEATVELLLDQSRRLPVIDPTGREAHLACGAALLNLRLALRGAGLGARLILCPDVARPDLLATVTVGGHAQEPPTDTDLRLAIPVRATHRDPFDAAELPGRLVVRLVAAAAYEGALATVLDPPSREVFEELSTAAEHLLWSDAAYRREVAEWSSSNHGQRADGVPGYAYGLTDWRARLEPIIVRLGHPPEAEEDRDARAASTAPLLLVLGSPDDRRESWLRAGAGMQRLLLAACTEGVAASFLNAALHTPTGRPDVGRIAGLDHPQVGLRLGFARPEPTTPRRAESVVLDVRQT